MVVNCLVDNNARWIKSHQHNGSKYQTPLSLFPVNVDSTASGILPGNPAFLCCALQAAAALLKAMTFQPGQVDLPQFCWNPSTARMNYKERQIISSTTKALLRL